MILESPYLKRFDSVYIFCYSKNHAKKLAQFLLGRAQLCEARTVPKKLAQILLGGEIIYAH